jgi:heme/copper-type cytochrome/quinol oxidase subunit 2
MRKILVLVILFILTATLIPGAGRSQTPAAAGYSDVTPDYLARILKQHKDFALIDVHVPEQKHLKWTDEFIPYDSLPGNLDKLPSDRNRKIVVYSRSGNMSRLAAQQLVNLGYTRVMNLNGGEQDWSAENLPVDGPDRIIYLTARKFSFTPDHITVKQNQRVKMIATSTDVAHGIYISDYRASSEILPGQENILEFTAYKSGDFEFRCTVYCGPGHADMKGVLTVEEE